jgi:hypothetical protein
MAPSNLQGLNIVHPAPAAPNPYLSDQDLLSVPPFHDLSAQLDLWTNLSFQSDEPLIPASVKDRLAAAASADKRKASPDHEERQANDNITETGSHENVIVSSSSSPPQQQQQQQHHQPQQQQHHAVPQLNAFDIGTLLASFGMDPFQMASHMPLPPQATAPAVAAAPSLAQLLSYHANQSLTPLVIPSEPSASTSSAAKPSRATSTSSGPAAKRARTSRSSSAEQQEVQEAASPDGEEKYASGTSVAATEDKRRRNTAASARFRLKKKEREAALEK